MKSLISINHKFMEINPKRLVEVILESKYTSGVEIYVNFNNEFEKKYLEDLVFELKKNNLILQVHGDIALEIEKQLEFLKLLEKYADYLDYPIVLTLHTIYDDDKDISIAKTLDYVSMLMNNIHDNKTIICLENLNDLKDNDRLNKENLRTMVLNDEKLYFTYDIGHEIADCGLITDLDMYMIEDIRNVHIHSIDNLLVDHKPIYENDVHWNKIMKALIFLINNDYKYNIVYEYGLEYCFGETVEEKLKDYLKSIDYISSKYGNQ